MEAALHHDMMQKILSKYTCLVKMVKHFLLKDERENNVLASCLVLLKYLCSKCDLQKNPPILSVFVYSYMSMYCAYYDAQA